MNRSIYIILGTLVALVMAFVLYGATGRDDNYISFWPAWAWVHEAWPLNYNGQALEQSSSFLWVALLAISHSITKIEIPTLAYCWGMLGLFATALASHRIGRQIQLSSSLLKWLPLLVGTQAYLAYWALSGMETVLATACMLWTLSAWLDGFAGKWPKWWLPMLLAWILIRPEAGFIALLSCTMAYLFALKGKAATKERKAIFQALFWAGCLTLLVIGSRLAITGQAFPNPAILKSSLPWWFKLKAGIKYLLFQGLMSDLGILGLGSVLMLWLGKLKLQKVQFLLLFPILALMAFVLLAGGDWMEAGRFLLPFGPLLLLLFLSLAEKAIPSRLLALLAPLLLLLNLGHNLKVAALDSTGSPAWSANLVHPDLQAGQFSSIELRNRGHLADAHGALALHQVLSQIEAQWHGPYRVMSGQAGMMMYYNAQWHRQQVEWLDFYGLATRHVADCQMASQILGSMQPYRWEYGGYFEMMAQAGDDCKAFKRPELVFDLDFASDPQHLAFERNGYQIVWKQEGFLRNSHFPYGSQVNGYLFIAISDEFLARLPQGIQIPNHRLAD